MIFDRSGLRCRFELGHLDGILFGDSGYACRSYLLTPVLRPETNAEVRYNTAHTKTRVIVEQLFGVWSISMSALWFKNKVEHIGGNYLRYCRFTQYMHST